MKKVKNMKDMKKLHFCLFCIFLVASVLWISCASISYSDLPEPSVIAEETEEYLLVSGKLPYMTENSVFNALFVAETENIDITLLLPTGQTFCTMSWDGSVLDYDSPFVENGYVFARAIINDFLHCFGDETLHTSDGYEISQSGSIFYVTNTLNGYSYQIEIL